MVATILELQSGIAWRQYYKRATFRSVPFYVDTGVRESARRVVLHEFPKRDVPYAEDMGRKARSFNVRGYCIAFVNDTTFPNDALKRKNYIPVRDALIVALETEGPAILQLPLLGALNVACATYRVTEEDKFGGYCVFDMTFQEYGQAPATGTRQSAPGVYYAADALSVVTLLTVSTWIKSASGTGTGIAI
jgi:prophage DNA circulation protein